jgi:hypothetical protein
MERVRSPVLALNGTKDVQVRADKNLHALESAAAKAGVPFQSISIKGLNHLFQEAGTGLPDEYATLKPVFSTQALDIIVTWLMAL